MRSLAYFFTEAFASLARGRASNLVAVGTIAVAVFVFGAFLLVTSALDRLMATWSEVAEMSVYLRDDTTGDQRAAIETALRTSALVGRREFVSKTEAARRFRRDFPDLAPAAEGLGANPFPASFEVRLGSQQASPTSEVARLARSIAGMPGVTDVRYDRQWLDRLGRLVTAVRWIGMALAAALAVAAGLTIAAVVRLAMFGRRDEVEIMSLMGAPLSAIRGPFVVEGILHGGVGSLVALGALRGMFEVVRASVPGLGALGPSAVQFLSLQAIFAILAGGMMVGCLGGWVATRVAR